ncbi:MAG: hypothetical protein LBQ51_01690 [Desulfovibrio sp.]|jgi:hypothetical protein|nr:hypothetical protein [Desulfovibrio sp.]
MAASKNLHNLVMEMIHGSRKMGMPKAGAVPEIAFDELQRRNQAYLDPDLLLSQHSILSRFQNPKDGWSEQRISDTIEALLNSSDTRAMPNFGGGNRFAREALIKPDSQAPLFAPVAPTKEGKVGLATIFETTPERVQFEIERLTGHQRGAPSLIRGLPSPGNRNDAASQLELSAVDVPSVYLDILNRLSGGVKTAAPFAVAGAGAEYICWGFLRQYLESARKRWGSIVKAHGEGETKTALFLQK